ncbi:2-acyl-glycerophospho-ethanolamine acyltransferase [bacterium BMS3Bbin02]|nr:2-acyl-glycerophospho-ethanolamine acyltransferase [bacterium BMS3Bbin02]
MDPLAELTKTALLALAREQNIKGRSRMTKAELVTALTPQVSPGPSPNKTTLSDRTSAVAKRTAQDREESRRRRTVTAQRLASFVDTSKKCKERQSHYGPCGLPVATGKEVCVLHGGADIFDLAIPVTGQLGVETWPTLLRHLMISDYETDAIGLDPIIAEVVQHIVNWLYFDYFRVEVQGIENVPMSGGALLAANHGGAALPYDAAMLALTVANEAAMPRRVRVIGTEIFNMLPTVSHLYRKAGAAYASRADTEHLLGNNRLVGVFPEGAAAFQKPASEAYRLRRFGRGGFVTVAERVGVPIIPVAIVGSDEVHPAVTSSSLLAKMVQMVFPDQRMDRLAIFLNPIPLPVRWHIRILEPLQPDNPGSDPDPLTVLERADLVRDRVQAALDDMLAARTSVF